MWRFDFLGELKRRLEDEPHASMDFSSMQKCQFCRNNPPNDLKDRLSALKKLVECGNKSAMALLAGAYRNGEGVLVDHKSKIELHHMTARAGGALACYRLGIMYWEGKTLDGIVIKKDERKAKRLFTKGARLGDPTCLCNLGVIRSEDYSKDDYVQYVLKAASSGCQTALDTVKKLYMVIFIPKREYANALRSFQAVHDEINSEARKRFNKRLASKQTMEDLFQMNQREQIETISNVLRCDFNVCCR